MAIGENISMALAGIKSNMMRAILTMLGIIIGIASVITIMTVGNSITEVINKNMSELGANALTVGISTKNSEDAVERDITDSDLITKEMLEAYAEQFKDQIDGIAVYESIARGVSQKGNKYANVEIAGVNADEFNSSNLDIIAGREMTSNDYVEGKNVCLVSDIVVNNMFDGDAQKALGETIEVEADGRFFVYYIVGVYDYISQSFYMGAEKDLMTTVYIPMKTARRQINKNSGYTSVQIIAKTGVSGEAFSRTTQDFFNGMYYLNNDAFEVKTFSVESLMKTFNTMISAVQTALAIIAGISLLVGGIGVMNIMLVSITERTREIGIRKALGATNSSIRIQFITESVVICIIGGIIGTLLGIGFGYLGMALVDIESSVSLKSIVIAVGFSMAIGVFFGYYPANKAAKLNPIEALRYE